MNTDKLKASLSLLTQAISQVEKDQKDPVKVAALSKAFEVCFEYSWKLLKARSDVAGMEVYSPRDAIKVGAQLNLINDPAEWNAFLNARNLSVHDYIGLAEAEYFPLAKALKQAAEALLKKL